MDILDFIMKKPVRAPTEGFRTSVSTQQQAPGTGNGDKLSKKSSKHIEISPLCRPGLSRPLKCEHQILKQNEAKIRQQQTVEIGKCAAMRQTKCSPEYHVESPNQLQSRTYTLEKRKYQEKKVTKKVTDLTYTSNLYGKNYTRSHLTHQKKIHPTKFAFKTVSVKDAAVEAALKVKRDGERKRNRWVNGKLVLNERKVYEVDNPPPSYPLAKKRKHVDERGSQQTKFEKKYPISDEKILLSSILAPWSPRKTREDAKSDKHLVNERQSCENENIGDKRRSTTSNGSHHSRSTHNRLISRESLKKCSGAESSHKEKQSKTFICGIPQPSAKALNLLTASSIRNPNFKTEKSTLKCTKKLVSQKSKNDIENVRAAKLRETCQTNVTPSREGFCAFDENSSFGDDDRMSNLDEVEDSDVDFIDDIDILENRKRDNDWRQMIRTITGYDPRKYRGIDEECEESNFETVNAEEETSARIASAEDAEELRLETIRKQKKGLLRQ